MCLLANTKYKSVKRQSKKRYQMPQEHTGAMQMNTRISKDVSKEKSVKIGTGVFQIPAHMDISGMVECWRDDSTELESLAKTIVETNPKFAGMIVHFWLLKRDYLLTENHKKRGEMDQANDQTKGGPA
jgi:hypothetical protein